MFLKHLMISTSTKVIREIPFHKGINLIVDESEKQVTGNNVGKTTVLRLIDFCLGATAKNIYVDPENPKTEYFLVKDYLIKNKIIITLTLGDCFDSNDEDITISRNFLSRKEAIYKINGEYFSVSDFEKKLSSLIFPELRIEKPTFRQVISHNIRYSDSSISNTLKTLDKYTTDAVYETLYLFLFGCNFTEGNSRQSKLDEIKTENKYKKRLENNKSRNEYEVNLEWVDNQIYILNKKKSELNINKDFEIDLQKLNDIKYRINSLSSKISSLTLRKGIILDAKRDFENQKTDIDITQLAEIYSQASSLIPNMQKSFEDLVSYHNQMIVQKVKFITIELPDLDNSIQKHISNLNYLLSQESVFSDKIMQSDTFDELEEIIQDLNNLFKQKGEYENIISQITAVEKNISKLNFELHIIDQQLFSSDFESGVKSQLKKFNKLFSDVSNQLYGEPYSITYDIEINKQGQKLYKFRSINVNHSSGKKQGEISCFDIAYILFANEEKISCLNFILNDKKELIHDNQLIKIAEVVNRDNIQFIASILKDKLPPELNKEEYFVVKLSQNDKLFRIEDA